MSTSNTPYEKRAHVRQEDSGTGVVTSSGSFTSLSEVVTIASFVTSLSGVVTIASFVTATDEIWVMNVSHVHIAHDAQS